MTDNFDSDINNFREDPSDPATLKSGEVHPITDRAYAYVLQNLSESVIAELKKGSEMGNNRLCEVCYGTVLRLREGLPVSDRYLIGLAWLMRDMLEPYKRK